jgi:hypothetical protein
MFATAPMFATALRGPQECRFHPCFEFAVSGVKPPWRLSLTNIPVKIPWSVLIVGILRGPAHKMSASMRSSTTDEIRWDRAARVCSYQIFRGELLDGVPDQLFRNGLAQTARAAHSTAAVVQSFNRPSPNPEQELFQP